MAVRVPPFLTRLTVQNFRSLRDVDIFLRPLNVLVGPNGAGKSNLLDVIDFLGDSVREDLAPALGVRGGFDRVRFRGPDSNPAEWIKVQIEAAVTKYSSRTALDRYTLEFTTSRLRRRQLTAEDAFVRSRLLLRRKETFLFKRTEGRGRRITVTGSDLNVITGDELTRSGVLQEGSLGLSTLPRLGPEEGGGSEQVEALASLFASFRVFDVDVNAIWSRQDDTASSLLENDASNLAAYMRYLHDNELNLFEALERDARMFIQYPVSSVYSSCRSGGRRADS